MLRFHLAPASLLHLISTILLTPALTSARPQLEAGVPFSQLFERGECNGQLCGWNDQLCCSAGSACYTDSANQAQCSSTGGGQWTPATVTASATAAGGGGGGYWQYYTTTYTDTEVYTSTVSSWMAGGAGGGATASATSASCDYTVNETPCGGICCKSSEYCYNSGVCKPAANPDSSAYYSSYYSTMYATTNSAGVPLRPTSSTLIIVTETNTPTTTVPFETPVATGANMTLTSDESNNSGGLSGGAIAGIVIGVLVGLLLLGLLCFYCCVRGLWVAIFGGGKKNRRRTTEIDEYERYSHHGSGAAAGRTWYGAPKRRVERRDDHRNRNRALGIGAGLAGLWAILGLKRRERRRNDEKYSEYSYSSDYYTSESEYSRFAIQRDDVQKLTGSIRQRKLRRPQDTTHRPIDVAAMSTAASRLLFHVLHGKISASTFYSRDRLLGQARRTYRRSCGASLCR